MNALLAWLLLSTSPALVNGDRFLFQISVISYLPDGDVSVVRSVQYLNYDEVQAYVRYSREDWERMRLIAKDIHHFVIIVDRSIT